MAGTRRKPGRMGPYIEGFRCRLLELGYTPGSVDHVLVLVGHLGRWMASEGLRASDLSDSEIEAFIAAQRQSRYWRIPTMRSLEPLLEYLRTCGVLPAEATPSNPLDELLTGYRTWLVVERGLADATVLRYDRTARRFLGERGRLVEGLSGAEVNAFLLRECGRVSVGAAKGRVAELRALLRFLYVKDLMPLALAPSVPSVAGWHDTALPRGITAGEVDRLLASCDRDSGTGLRDFAILMLVARLGLRSVEVARLELGDVDWRVGEILVRGKARRHDHLPLPGDVGKALADYLQRARPETAIRRVFITQKAPRQAIYPDLVHDVTRRACRRVGLPPVGPHRLRHALATEMLRHGAKLFEVSQVLRHRDLATTAIYAKVDLASLRLIAQPWPAANQ